MSWGSSCRRNSKRLRKCCFISRGPLALLKRTGVQKDGTIYQRSRYNLAPPLGEPGSKLSLPYALLVPNAVKMHSVGSQHHLLHEPLEIISLQIWDNLGTEPRSMRDNYI